MVGSQVGLDILIHNYDILTDRYDAFSGYDVAIDRLNVGIRLEFETDNLARSVVDTVFLYKADKAAGACDDLRIDDF